MKLENQVCTLQQAKRLRELGISQDSFFYHIPAFNEIGFKTITGIAQTIDGATYSSYEIVSAFNVAELGVMFGVGTRATDWLVNVKIDTSTKTLIWRPEFLADCLIEALENNLTTAAEVNERLKQN